jgi:hypothetical protein
VIEHEMQVGERHGLVKDEARRFIPPWGEHPILTGD